MQIHPVALSLPADRFKVTAELAMRRKTIPEGRHTLVCKAR